MANVSIILLPGMRKYTNLKTSTVLVLTNNLKDVRENVMGGLLSTPNGPDSLLDAVPANGSDGPYCLPVPLCLKRMQVLQRNQDHDCCGSQLKCILIWNI